MGRLGSLIKLKNNITKNLKKLKKLKNKAYELELKKPESKFMVTKMHIT